MLIGSKMRSSSRGKGKAKPLRYVLLRPPMSDPNRWGMDAPPREAAAGAPTLTSDTDDLNHFTIQAVSPNYEGVIVKYWSLPANQPNTYGNSVSLWNSTIPNLQVEPLASEPITDNSEVGSVFIPYGFQQTNYSVTYQTTDYTSMCALAQILLAPAAVPIPTYVSLTISSLDSSGVKVIYSTLPGYTPAKYKNWVGVWQGYESPYSTGSALNTVPIPTDASQGEVAIPFTPGPFTYTLIYFLGENRITAGALLYFQVSS